MRHRHEKNARGSSRERDDCSDDVIHINKRDEQQEALKELIDLGFSDSR